MEADDDEADDEEAEDEKARDDPTTPAKWNMEWDRRPHQRSQAFVGQDCKIWYVRVRWNESDCQYPMISEHPFRHPSLSSLPPPVVFHLPATHHPSLLFGSASVPSDQSL